MGSEMCIRDRDRYELPNSAMPADLQLLMSVDELVDLVEYLTVLK